MPGLVRKLKRSLKRVAKRNAALRKAHYRLVAIYHGLRLKSAGKGVSSGNSDARLDRIEPGNIIWIFCTSRSGSTWLRSMLADLVPSRVWEEPKIGLLFGGFYDRAQEGQLGSPDFVMGDPTRRAWVKALRNFVLDTALASHPSITRREYLVVKEPDGAIGAPVLLEALPESRMVLLVRDPRDVAASALDGQKKGNWMYEAQDEVRRREQFSSDEKPNIFLRRRSMSYLKHISNARRAYEAHKGHKAIVRYEDLRADTLATMQSLCAALGIPAEEEQLVRVIEKHSWERVPQEEKGTGKFYRKAEPGGWREDLTPKQVQIVQEITAPVLEEFYPEKP